MNQPKPSPRNTYFELVRYEIKNLEEQHPQMIGHCPISCDLCGSTISLHSGPGKGQICNTCGDALIAGRLRGIV